ncbi:conserved hypothetical protein [uncultured Alphaproteobacteria bacterium]|uniref:Putative exodeoxyribonuclease 8 PDDEXK-like domain-containing protein n=1 Tax=uncultured Alphaproteobacteria bacterium TaxID=91750 RepID=A0A212KLV9_9PROT|nr:conserved hypothetical protein [uncultured Alphaproteobacteria bacterium]
MITITQPGIYDIPLDVYHADPCPTPSLSASGAKIILDECPAKFWHQNPRLNPAAEREETKALSVGQAAHTLILQGDDAFAGMIAVMPADLDLRSSAGKAFAAEAKEAGKTLIRAKEFEEIQAMRDAAMRCDWVRLAFASGAPERSLFWQDAETGVWLRCRPDYLPDALRFVPDFKTARSCAPADFERAVIDYGYHIQAAHYLNGIEAVTGERPESFFFVVQEKAAPYLVSVCTLDDDALHWGQQLIRRAIRTFADCLSRDRWPGYDRNVSMIGLPKWATSRYEAMEAAGLFDITPKEDMNHAAAAE